MSGGAISLHFWSQFCYSYFPYIKVKIPARYLNPESRDDFVANPASRRYLNPESRDNFGANPVSRNQKRPHPASRETPSGAPFRLIGHFVGHYYMSRLFVIQKHYLMSLTVDMPLNIK